MSVRMSLHVKARGLIAEVLKNGGQATINRLARLAMHTAGVFWLVHFRPLHFGPNAARRYHYAFREPAWIAAKLAVPPLDRQPEFRRRWNWAHSMQRKGTLPPVPFIDPRPLELTGELKAMVLDKTASAFNIRATATRNRQRVRVFIPLPHPLNPKNAGEVTRLLKSEMQAMGQAAQADFIARANESLGRYEAKIA